MAKPPDIEGSRRRRKRVMATIVNGRQQNRKRIASLEYKRTNNPNSLTDWDRENLKSAQDASRPQVRAGAPTQLAQFHKWMAVHYHWERSQPGVKGKLQQAKTAYSKVRLQWGVSQTTIVDAIRRHGAAATALAKMQDVKQNIDIMAATFRDLASS